MSIRPQKYFNQILNNGIILPSSLAVFATGQSAYIELIRNGTLTGASWSAVDPGNSFSEWDTSATAISGGSTVFATYAVNTAGVPVPLSENVLSRLVVAYSQLMDQADTLTLVGTSLSGNANLSGALTWKEIR